jgi:hypothetical protein
MNGHARRLVAIALAAALAPVVTSAASTTAAAAEGGAAATTGACSYRGDLDACFPYGCVAVDAAGRPIAGDPDLIRKGTPGRCGPCTSDDQCGGARCRVSGQGAGTCAAHDDTPPPLPIRPKFSLLVADVSVNLADSADSRPIVSVGYLGQIALRSARPMVREGGGFITPDPPRFYADASLSAAFAGPAQNVFATAGVTYYLFSGPLALTTLAVGALYQRQGSEIWQLDAAKNRDRVGPAVTLGFLQNLYLRGAYVFGVAGPDHHGAVILSLIYMRDLASDLASSRFTKHLPKALR